MATPFLANVRPGAPDNTFQWLLHFGQSGPLDETPRRFYLGDGTELPFSVTSFGLQANELVVGSGSWQIALENENIAIAQDARSALREALGVPVEASDIGASPIGHNHSGVYQPVLAAYATIAALSGYPTAFPTSASQISDLTAAGRGLLTFATPASAKYLRINANGTVTGLTAEELAVEMFSAGSSSRRHWPLYYTLVRTTTASGGSVPNAGLGTVAVSSGTTSGGLAIARITGDLATDSELTYPGDALYKLNFDRRHRIRMTVGLHLAAGTGTGWMIFGAPYNLASGAAPAQKGFGLKFTTAGVALWVHNGTTLTVAAATAMTLATYAEIALDFWAGTLSGSLNGVALAGASSGPTGLSATDNGVVAMVAYSPATSDNMRIQISHPTSLTTAN